MGDDVNHGMMGELWVRIVAWLEENAPRSADALVRTGATETDLADAETSTGIEWTDELRTWFTVQGGAGHLGTLQLHGLLEPLSLQEALAARETHLAIWRQLVADDPDLQEAPGRAGSDGLSFQPEFVPIADDPGGSVLVVDLRPGARRGCVGTLLDGHGATFRELGWPSIAAWLEDVEAALSEGSPSPHGIPAVEDGRLVWRIPEPAYEEFDVVYGGGYLEVLDVNDPRVPPLDEQQIAAFRARLGAGPDGPPPGWTGPWPPELPSGIGMPDGEPLVLSFFSEVAIVGGPPPVTTRLHLTYRRDQDPRALAPRAARPPAPTQRPDRPAATAPVAPLRETWAAVVAWLEGNAPVTARKVADSATDPDEVAAAEAAAAMAAWPEDLRWWFTVAPHLVLNSEGDHLLGPYEASTAARAVEERASWIDLASQYGSDDEPGLAGEETGDWAPEFVPIATEGTGTTFVVDLRPGPLHGCVMHYSAEDGASGDDDGGPLWPSLAAMVADLLGALTHGDEFDAARAEVVDGELIWVFDDQDYEDHDDRAPRWAWSVVRDRVAAAWVDRDDDAVWAAIVDGLLTIRDLDHDEAVQASWQEPDPVGDPFIDALIMGAACYAEMTLGLNGAAFHWADRTIYPSVPVEAGVGRAELDRLHTEGAMGFSMAGLLIDPIRLPY